MNTATQDRMARVAMDTERKRVALHWQSVLARYGLSYTIERLNYTRNAGGGFRPKYAIVTPCNKVPQQVIKQCIVTRNERTRFGMGWRDRQHNAFIFNLNHAFPSFIYALQQHDAPKQLSTL